MQRTILCFTLLATLACVTPARADITVNVGTHQLLPNTPGQTIEIFSSGPDSILGISVFAQIADGGPDPDLPEEIRGVILGPTITGMDLLAGTIIGTQSITQQDPIDNNENAPDAYEQVEARSTALINTLTPNGKIATLTIDTTGFFAGSGPFPLVLTSTLGGFTEFFRPDSSIVPSSITNGLIVIAEVPEPSGIALALAGAVALLAVARARRRQAAPRAFESC